MAPPESSSAAAILRLQREISSKRHTLEGLEAAAEMEQHKLDEDPDYERSFLEMMLAEQEPLRRQIEEAEARLEKLTAEGE